MRRLITGEKRGHDYHGDETKPRRNSNPHPPHPHQHPFARFARSGEAAARADFGTQNFLDSSTSPDGVAARDILGDLTEAERSSEIGRSILSLSTVLNSLHGVILAQRGAGGQQTQKQVPQARNAWPGVQVQAQPQHQVSFLFTPADFSFPRSLTLIVASLLAAPQQNHHDDTPPPPVVPPFPNAPHHNQPAPDASNNTIQHNMHAHLEIQVRNLRRSLCRSVTTVSTSASVAFTSTHF